jgi:hypothetical protein
VVLGVGNGPDRPQDTDCAGIEGGGRGAAVPDWTGTERTKPNLACRVRVHVWTLNVVGLDCWNVYSTGRGRAWRGKVLR